MKGCACATCEGQRAYQKRPEVLERRAAQKRAAYGRTSEAQYARMLSKNRNWKRAAAERRDQETTNRLRRAA